MAKVIDPEQEPTRREKEGGGPQPKNSPFLKEADDWMKAVQCPLCGSPMALLKGRRGRYGANITYQCHTETKPRSYCLTVMTVTVGGNRFMRPGDFDVSDIGWEDVAEEAIEVEDGDIIKGVPRIGSDFLPHEAPPTIWVRNVRRKVIWDSFWDLALDNQGVVCVDKLVPLVLWVRKKDADGDNYDRLMETIYDIPNWMTKRTGYLIIRKENTLQVIGQGGGSESLYPYSQEDYRQAFGLEG